MDLTLRQLCAACCVSRRAVQGYEKLHLVAPSGRTERGYLLYDRAAVERVQRIRRFQSFGFSVKEIAGLLDAPSDVLKAALTRRLAALEQSQTELDEVLDQLRAMIGAL